MSSSPSVGDIIYSQLELVQTYFPNKLIPKAKSAMLRWKLRMSRLADGAWLSMALSQITGILAITRQNLQSHTVRPAKTQFSLCIWTVWSVFVWCSLDSQGFKASSCGQWRLWPDCADAQADLSLRWTLMWRMFSSCAGSFCYNIKPRFAVENWKLDWISNMSRDTWK